VTASSSRSNECEDRANFTWTFNEGDVQASSMALKDQGGFFYSNSCGRR
jgi:hypothetical protein